MKTDKGTQPWGLSKLNKSVWFVPRGHPVFGQPS